MTLSIVYMFLCVSTMSYVLRSNCLSFFTRITVLIFFTTDTLFYGLTYVLLSSGRLASLVKLFWRGVILSVDTI